MKNFLSMAMACLCAFTALNAFGANPAYTNFKGIGGVTVTTNPPNGDVTIDGSGISAGALPTFALTNNQTTPVNLASHLRVAGVFSNVTSAIFLGTGVTNNGIQVVGGNTILLGTLNVNNGGVNSIFADGRISGNALIGTNFIWNLGYTTNLGGFTNGGHAQFHKSIGLLGITASRVLMVDGVGNVTNVASSSPSTEYVKPDGTTAAFTGLGVGSLIQVSATSNHVANLIDVGSGEARLYGTNQVWKDFLTDAVSTNQTIAFQTLQSNIVYELWFTNNASTVAMSNSVKWPFEPAFAAPQLTGGRYRIGIRLDDQGTNAWIIEGPALNIGPGQNMGFTTNTATGLITIATSLTPSFTTSTVTNGIMLMATNANLALLKTANSNAAPVTNILGHIRALASYPLVCDANLSHNTYVTNPINANITIISSNTFPGQEITWMLLGTNADKTVTIIPQLGNLVINGDIFTAVVASSTGFIFTLTNGNMVEVSERIVSLNGTNFSSFITKQSTK